MESFRWEQCFVTGLTTVDEQHHYLVDIINQFGELLMQPQGAGPEAVETLFQELKSYTQYHFREEEALMLQSGMDAGHIEFHKKEHVRFLQDVSHMHTELTDDTEPAKALLNFLTNWLAYHILGTDQLMTGLMKAHAAGAPAQEALEAFQRTKDPATATLLQAMKRLFDQVSERSRALFELNRTLEARVAERTLALSQMNDQLETMAMTDVLTGLPNRRQAMRVLERDWQAATDQNTALACMMIDADGFKKINDTYGHDAGDEVLRQLARCLSQAVRNDDIVCRLGGDEFLIICAHTSLDGAVQAAEKVRSEVAALRVPAGTGQWCGSISVGVAARASTLADVEALLKLADESVYLAKANGRNAVAAIQRS